MITLVLGGTRSGKSAVAETIAARRPGPVTYVATGWADPDDTDMAARIARHRERRPQSWRTIESGPDLAAALRSCPPGTVLVDALGTWVASVEDFAVDVSGLLGALRDHIGDVVLVSDEVGMGVHPSSEIGRRFRDVLGDVNRLVGEVCDEVLLVVAGRILPLAAP